MDEDRIARRLLERMPAMKVEMGSLRWSEKLRSDGDSQQGMNRVF